MNDEEKLRMIGPFDVTPIKLLSKYDLLRFTRRIQESELQLSSSLNGRDQSLKLIEFVWD
jgi:hypothetical protein